MSLSAATPTASSLDGLIKSLQQGADAKGEAAKASGDDTEDRFLKLLVAQMNNQDPLNPLDNAQVTTQLAQINTVKGLDKLNTAMQKLLEKNSGAETLDAAGMVGRRVLVPGDALELGDKGGSAGFELAGEARSVVVEVLDKSGNTVDTRMLANQPAGAQRFDWDGKSGAKTSEPGTYRIRVSATNGTEKVEATPLAAVPVQAVIRGAQGTAVQLGKLGALPLEEIKGIL